MPHTQEGRLISIDTPLGADKLLLAGFTGQEAMSRLFSFHVDLLAEPEPGDPPIDFKKIVGQSVTISVVQSDDSSRYFNGIVSQFAMTGLEGTYTRYEMQVVPKVWTLTRYANCRIFHHKDVKEIISDIFSSRSFSDYEFSLNASYPKMEYCVQYRETDFNFISRLMEKFGIFYYFEHQDGSHTMKILDSNSSIAPCPNQDNAEFNMVAGGLDDDDVVNSWSLEWEWKSGKIAHTDYNFKTPPTNLATDETTIYSVANSSRFELFDYPGEYQVRADGTQLAKMRMEEEEAGHLVGRGSSVCRPFTTGYKFNLKGHPQTAYNESYILAEIQHAASGAGGYSLAAEGSDSYSNHFTCIPESVNFRPARLTPKPFVQGLQTAVVVGKSSDQDSFDDDSTGGDGEEIWVDKYGRVMVRFFWDRDNACSCWVRVSQDWAGKGWGMINIPRVGQEVLVSFLEGDPDRPIITGRVYNENQQVPYKLPDYGTRTTFKTRSTTGGGDDNYNELRFEDKKGKEQVFVHAEFDQDNYVKNDSREWIGNNRSLLVTKDQMDSIGGDYHEEISKNNTIKIGSDRNEQVGGKEIIKIGSDRNEQVGGNEVIKIGGDSNRNVSGNHNEKIGSTLSLQVGQNLYEKSGMNYAHQAGMAIHLKAGMSVVIEAGMELTLKAGGSFIDIGPAGIAISGAPLVMINSGGAAGSGCGSSPVSPTDPVAPKDPKDPDLADDGKSGTKRGSGNAANSGSGETAFASAPSAGAAASAPSAASSPSSLAALPSPAAPSLPVSADSITSVANQATQEASQAANQAAQTAQQAANQAQQAASQAQQEAQQAEQQAQQAVDQVKQQARQAYQQANQAVQQAQQAVNQAAAQAKAQAQQALSQAQQLAQQTAQQAAQAVQQAEQQAQQVQQQAQQAAQQAQQAAQQAQQQAQQAAQQAQQAAQQAQQQAQQAAQQAQQQAQQAMQQGQQAVQQAQQQAQQAAQQAKQAAQQAQQQAQQAAQQAQQAAQQAQQQAQQATQQAQQAGQQVQQAASESLQQAQQSAQGAQQAAQQAMSGLGHGI
jgi:type VI secretion system secreted protein VgrG